MGILANYTLEEFEAQIEDKSAEELVMDFLSATNRTEIITLKVDVKNDLNENNIDYNEYENVQEFEEFLLYEDRSFSEIMVEKKADIALDALEAYLPEGEYSITTYFEITQEFFQATQEKIQFEIEFSNPTEAFQQAFYKEGE